MSAGDASVHPAAVEEKEDVEDEDKILALPRAVAQRWPDEMRSLSELVRSGEDMIKTNGEYS